MVKSTFISIGLHVFFILVAYYGLPSFKVKEPFEQPIDIVEDTLVGAKTVLKLGNPNKEVKKIKKDIVQEDKVKKTPPPPPPLPSKKIIDKKNIELKKKKKLKEIAELIKKKPKSKIEKNKKVSVPKVKTKPKEIKKKQNKILAKGILKTLTKPQPIINKDKINKSQNNNKNVLNKLKQIVGNTSKRSLETEAKLTQTEIDKLRNYISKCWDTSIGASEVKIIIPLKISANMDGSVNSVEIDDQSRYVKDTFYRATADSARRAVLDCSPLPLPKNKASQFKSFFFDFDTSFIYRY
jgi:outer membrane biosynthesis protein TonB